LLMFSFLDWQQFATALHIIIAYYNHQSEELGFISEIMSKL
jgi:hypothetical protein